MAGAMVDLKHAARLAGLALAHPVEFSDRLAGRRERLREGPRPSIDAETADPIAVGHRLSGAEAAGCCAELADVRQQVSRRLSGHHHHDGGSSLAEMLWVLVRHRRPAVVIETGVARGVSSAFILDALKRNGHGRLWSVDLPPVSGDWGDQTGIAVADDLRDRWTYVRGASRRKLPKLVLECAPIDIFIHDGLHTSENMLFEMRTVWGGLAPDGLIVADDADHSHAVLTFAEETGAKPVLIREPAKEGVIAVIPRN